MNKNQRKIKDICDTYMVEEVTDGIDGKKFLEVSKLVPGNYDEEPESYEYCFDIDGTLACTDQEILDEINSIIDD